MRQGKAHTFIAMHVHPGSGYDRNAECIVPGEVMRDHGQSAVDLRVRNGELAQDRGIKPGTHFKRMFRQLLYPNDL
jgi:hypothetical protein